MFDPATAIEVSLCVVWSVRFESIPGVFTRTLANEGAGAAVPP